MNAQVQKVAHEENENQFFVTDYASCIRMPKECQTYSLNVQVDKAGSKGKENITTDHASCVRIRSE